MTWPDRGLRLYGCDSNRLSRRLAVLGLGTTVKAVALLGIGVRLTIGLACGSELAHSMLDA